LDVQNQLEGQLDVQNQWRDQNKRDGKKRYHDQNDGQWHDQNDGQWHDQNDGQWGGQNKWDDYKKDYRWNNGWYYPMWSFKYNPWWYRYNLGWHFPWQHSWYWKPYQHFEWKGR